MCLMAKQLSCMISAFRENVSNEINKPFRVSIEIINFVGIKRVIVKEIKII